MNETLRLAHVQIALPGRALITSLDLRIHPGECVTVMGPSGCGKSSLLAYISGTLQRAFVASGAVSIGKRELTLLPPERRRVGILFQDDLLFPHMSVGGNLAFALPAQLRDPNARRLCIANALEECDLPDFAQRNPATLSGGQRARVALMRTLLAQPQVLLLDEPFNRLDAPLRDTFRRFVFEHAVRRGLPMLLVTHDIDDAKAAKGPVIQISGKA